MGREIKFGPIDKTVSGCEIETERSRIVASVEMNRPSPLSQEQKDLISKNVLSQRDNEIEVLLLLCEAYTRKKNMLITEVIAVGELQQRLREANGDVIELEQSEIKILSGGFENVHPKDYAKLIPFHALLKQLQ